MKNLMLSVVALAVVSSSAMASGFRCDGGDGYSVKLYNSLNHATRTPAVMVVSHGDSDPSTLLTAKGSEIHKINRTNTVQFVTGGAAMELAKVILQVNFKEGVEALEAGDVVPGQLILVDDLGRKDVVQLSCTRYLKN